MLGIKVYKVNGFWNLAHEFLLIGDYKSIQSYYQVVSINCFIQRKNVPTYMNQLAKNS